ncbi:MAG: chromosome segregation protein SMC [Aigarchaeota archaeon]|nr:chromosome segregation protein SMC [Aigarchaeota archaeon]MDW8093009.1 chromosome segregation SMC family protein [Nitrososphaerota archaeon]
MVYLKKIVINGFKSFGLRRNVIPLEKGYVVITGPNGGGKSNVIDAIKFALGELSAQALRASRLSDLVYEGNNGQRANLASVSVVLDNSERALPIDKEEVTISRKLLPNGESLYQINGKTVSRSDILTLLATCNIRPSSVNIITQGAVLGIAEMSPEEMRKLLDEVAGTLEYDRRKDEAMVELDKAERNIAVAKASTSEIKQMVRQLEREATHVKRKSLIERDLNCLRWIRVSKELSEIEERRVRLSEEEATLIDRRRELDDRMKSLQQEKSVLTEELRACNEAISTAQAEVERLETELRRTFRDMEEVKTRIRHLGSLYVTGVKEVQATVNNISRASERERELLRELELLSLERSRVKSELGELHDKIVDIRSRRDAVLRALKDLDEEERRLTHQSNEQQRRMMELERQRHELRTQIRVIGDETLKLDQRLRAIEEEETELGERLERFQRDRSSLLQEIEELRSKIKSTEREIAELRGLSKEIDDHLLTCLKLLAEVEKEVPIGGREESEVARLIGCRLPGDEFIGVLKDLVSPPRGFEALFRELLGDRESSIVVRRRAFAEALVRSAAERGMPLYVIAVEGWKGCKLKSCIACSSNYKDRESLAALHYALEASSLSKGDEGFDVLPSVTRRGAARLNVGLYRSYGEVEDSQSLIEEAKSLRSSLEELEGIKALLPVKVARLEESLRSHREDFLDKQKKITEIDSLIRSAVNRRDSIRSERDSILTLRARRNSEVEEKRKELEDLMKIEVTNESLDAKRSEICAKRESMMTEISSYEEELRGLNNKLGSLEERSRAIEANVKKLESEIRRIVESTRAVKIEERRAEVSSLKSSIKSMAARYADLNYHYQRLKDDSITKRNELVALRSREQELKDRLTHLERSIMDMMKGLYDLDALLNSLRVELMELNIRSNSLHEKLGGAPVEDVTIFSMVDDDQRRSLEAALEAELQTLQLVNQLSPMQYEQLSENYKMRAIRIGELEEERRRILSLIEMINAEKLAVFMRTFERVSREAGYYFNKLTGGEAWLELADPERPLESGVEMVVRFVGKPPRSSRGISGGEKSVSAVALLMGLQGLTPADFYIFDEVDAHMDVAYTRNLAALFKEMSRKTQIITVSLKDIMGEHADQLIGVYSQHGESRIVITKLGETIESKAG